MVALCQNTLFPKLPTRNEKYKMLEALREGTKIIQEIQIETYGSLETKDKVEFILYQMKLVLMRKDFVRCQILSRKISKRHLSEVGLEALKIQYFLFMI